MGCCGSAHRDQDCGSAHRDQDSDQDPELGPGPRDSDQDPDEDQDQVWRGRAYKSPAPIPVREARFTGRDCSSPLATICNDAVKHVLEEGEVQQEHKRYAPRNATFIAGAFNIEADPADKYVVVVRSKQGDLFDPMDFKKRMDCLLKNYLGVKRGAERQKSIVYGKAASKHGGGDEGGACSGEGPSLQLGTARRRRRRKVAEMKALLLDPSGEPWPIKVLHGFLHYKAEIVLRRVRSNPCILTSCICGQHATRPVA